MSKLVILSGDQYSVNCETFGGYITGKSLSEALLFAEHMANTYWGEHVVYKNCSECQKQFMYTTCFPQV